MSKSIGILLSLVFLLFCTCCTQNSSSSNSSEPIHKVSLECKWQGELPSIKDVVYPKIKPYDHRILEITASNDGNFTEEVYLELNTPSYCSKLTLIDITTQGGRSGTSIITSSKKFNKGGSLTWYIRVEGNGELPGLYNIYVKENVTASIKIAQIKIVENS